MPGIKALVAAISTEVVSALAAANYPALVDEKILLGKQFQFEQSAPPRIIFTPIGSEFPMKDVYNASRTGTQGYTAEQLAQLKNRSIATDKISFEVRCWGVSSNQDPDDDYDFTQALYHQVVRTVLAMARGSAEFSGGKWTDASFSSGQLVRDGREFVFNVTFGTPILALLEPLPTTADVDNPPVVPGIADSLALLSGQSEAGCEEGENE